MDYRFIADTNVGKLAKWLRILGYDTLFLNPVEDDELLQVARLEDRVLVTRDRALVARRMVRRGLVRALLVQSDQWQDQLRQVVLGLELELPAEGFSRCLRCNVALAPQEREQVRDRVPPYVFSTQQVFKECPQCGRIYWRGTHWEHVREALRSVDA